MLLLTAIIDDILMAIIDCYYRPGPLEQVLSHADNRGDAGRAENPDGKSKQRASRVPHLLAPKQRASAITNTSLYIPKRSLTVHFTSLTGH